MSVRSTRFVASLLEDKTYDRVQRIDGEIKEAFILSTGLLSAPEAAYIRTIIRDYDFLHEMREVNIKSIERLPGYVQEKIIEWDNSISMMKDRLDSISRRGDVDPE